MKTRSFTGLPSAHCLRGLLISPARVFNILLLYGVLAGGGVWVAFGATDPVEDVKRFSEFRTLDSSRLLEGEVLGERGSLMEFPQGIFAQTCFVVPVPPDEAAQRLQLWTPSPRQAPGVLAFSPVSVPCAAGDFQSLSLRPTNHAVRWLLDKSLKTTGGRSDLNLSLSEARELDAAAKSHPDAQSMSTYWAQLLQARTTSFQREGFAGVIPYEAGGKTISPTEDLRTMLREKPAVEREFISLLERCGLLGKQGGETLTPFHYWGLYEIDHCGTLNLGAVYSLALGDRHLLLDAQYYVSGAYYTGVTLYEVWPIQVGAKPGALVWRGDFMAAPTLAFAKGAERLAYGAIMLQELKKAVRCFQNDVTARP